MITRAATAALVASALLIASDAHAAASRVDLVLVAPIDAGRANALAALVADRLASAEVETRTTLAPEGLDLRSSFESMAGRRLEAQAPLARIWIDGRVATSLGVYIAAVGADRVLARQVPTPDGLDEVAAEQVTTIVGTTVDLIARGSPIGEPRAEVVERLAPTAPASAPAATTEVHAEVAAWGAAQRWTEDAVVPQAGVAAALLAGRHDVPWSAGGSVALGVRAPFSTTSAMATLDTGGGTAELLALARRRLSGWLALRFGAGLAFDLRLVRGSFPDGSRVEEREIVVGARALAGAEISLASHVSLVLAATADAPWLQNRYVVRLAGETTPALTPLRVRAGVLVWLAVAL